MTGKDSGRRDRFNGEQSLAEFRPSHMRLGISIFAAMDGGAILAGVLWLAGKDDWPKDYVGFSAVLLFVFVASIWDVASMAGYRIVVTAESLIHRRYGRSTHLNWPEIVQVSMHDRHVSLETSRGEVRIRRDIENFDELVSRIRLYAGSRFHGRTLAFPIRFYYPVHSNAWFWIIYGSLVFFYLAEPLEGRFNEDVTRFLTLRTPFALWLLYLRSRRYVFELDKMAWKSLVSKSEVAVSDIRDMWIEHVDDPECGPRDELHFNLPGGEELTLREGNVGVRDLFDALAPHYLRGEGSGLARTTSVLGI